MRKEKVPNGRDHSALTTRREKLKKVLIIAQRGLAVLEKHTAPAATEWGRGAMHAEDACDRQSLSTSDGRQGMQVRRMMREEASEDENTSPRQQSRVVSLPAARATGLKDEAPESSVHLDSEKSQTSQGPLISNITEKICYFQKEC